MSSGRRVGHVDRARAQIDGRDFCKHHREIRLLLLDLTNRRRDLGGCQNRGRHLVEKRLKDVMIAPIDQNHLGIASFQGPRRRDPGKAAADDDDALLLRWRCFWARFSLAGLSSNAVIESPYHDASGELEGAP
jgi:hypothetical protein